jgi:RNA binding exosome subunit
MLAFMDSGSDNNYISREVTLRTGLQPSQKKLLYSLHTANREEMPEESVINYEVNTTLHIHGHKQRIYLDIMRLADHNIILDIP